MMPRRAGLIALILVLSGTSCTDPGELRVDPDLLPLFRTGSMQYQVRRVQDGREVTFDVVFTNHTERTVYFVNCNGDLRPALQQQVGDTWTTVWAPIKNTCLGPPITVAPAAIYTYHFSIFGADSDTNIVPKFEATNLNGTFRLIWGGVVFDYQSSGPSFGEGLPGEYRVSNAFTLSSPPTFGEQLQR